MWVSLGVSNIWHSTSTCILMNTITFRRTFRSLSYSSACPYYCWAALSLWAGFADTPNIAWCDTRSRRFMASVYVIRHNTLKGYAWTQFGDYVCLSLKPSFLSDTCASFEQRKLLWGEDFRNEHDKLTMFTTSVQACRHWVVESYLAPQWWHRDNDRRLDKCKWIEDIWHDNSGVDNRM